MITRMGEEDHLLLLHIARTGRDRVQHRLPDVGRAAVDDGHLGAPGLAEALAQAGGELQAGDPAADDDDAWGCHG